MILYGKLLIGIYTQRNEVFSKAIVFIVLLLSKVQSFKNCFRILLLYCFHFCFCFFFFSTIKNSISNHKYSNRIGMNYNCFYCTYSLKTRINIICNRSWPSGCLFPFHSVYEEVMIKLPGKILLPNSPEPTQARTALSFTNNNVLFLALPADAVQNQVLFARLGKLLIWKSWDFSFYKWIQ